MHPLLVLIPLPLLAEQPDAHWAFDGPTLAERLAEGYGRVALDAGEAVGASSWNTRSGFGEVLANGTDDPYLEVAGGAALDPGSGDFSISVWSYRSTDDGSAAGIVDALDNVGIGFQFFYQASGALRLRLDDDLGNTVNADTAGSQLSLNTWRHLAVTVDRGNDRVRYYVDGSEVAPLGGVDISAVTGALSPDQDLWIGTLNANNPTRGRLDDLAFFKRLLTPAEIEAITSDGGTPVLEVFPPAPGLPEVAFSPPSGILREGESVTLSTDPAGEIRYTLDGSDPDAASDVYSSPFPLPSGGTVKARAVDGDQLGPVATASYVTLPAEVPNVLVVMADDLGFNDLGCYGSVSTSTPRLDALARAGQRFTQFTTAGPGDLASQYALLTGRLPRRGDQPAVASPGTGALDSREWTLGELFRKAGHATGLIGAWHLGDLAGSRPADQGFVLFHGLPWAPELAPAPPLEENGSTIDPAPDPNTLLDELTLRAESFIAEHAAEPFLLVFQPPSLPATGMSLLGDYGNRVEALDGAVGRLLDQLEASGVADQTLVVFLSDGGADKNTGTYPTGSNGQQRDGKGTTWEGGVRVPLIVRWPDAIPSGDNYAVVWLPDLLPSLATILRGFVPDDRPYDGRDRCTALLGLQDHPDDDTTLYLHRHTGGGYELQALRSGKWKLHQSTLNTDPDNDFTGSAPLLFDLLTDPIEHVNRAGSHGSTLAALQQLASEHEASFATPLPQLPPERDAFLGPVDSAFARTTETTVTFTFTRPADSLNDHYLLQTGNDLSGWENLAVDPYIRVSPGPDGTEAVEVTVPLETLGGMNSRFFVRLMSQRP